MSAAIWFVAGAASAWCVRSAIDFAIAKLATRLFTSAIGKRKVLEALAQAYAKLDGEA